MRSIILLCAFILFAWRLSSTNLKEAIASKLVTVEMTGSNYDSIPPSMGADGFKPKMQMTVSNLSDHPVALDLDPGYMLEADEPGYQAMLLTQSVDIKLNPREKKKDFLYAMCTELTKSGPGSSLHYQVAGKAKPALLQMALFIASKKFLVHAAQEAVWSISDDLPVMSITDKNHAVTDALQKEAASIKGLHIDELKREYDKRKSTILAEFNTNRVDRNIPFVVEDSAVVSAGYYNQSGQLMWPVYTNVLLRAGKHSIRYNPFPVAYTGQRYTFKVIKDGAVYKEYNFRQ